MSNEKVLIEIKAHISPHAKKRLTEIALEKHLPLSRLIGIALDNEMSKEKPFEFDTRIPVENYTYGAFDNEAGCIYRFLKIIGGMGLDSLLLLRHDIGIPDKERFLLGLQELIEKKIIEKYRPKGNANSISNYSLDYEGYRFTKAYMPEKIMKRSKDAKKYQKNLLDTF